MQHFYHLLRKSIMMLLAVVAVQQAQAQAPSITTHPSSSTICSGSNTSFTVTATGTGLSYQWQVDQGIGFSNVSGSVYSGGTSATLSLTGATTSMNNDMYRCIVSNTSGADTSNAATLTVNALPSILADPSPVTLCAGGDTKFYVYATGAGITYQWQVNTGSGFTNISASAPYSGVSTDTLSITGVAGSMNGYQYRCVVSGTCTPAATSASATLTVNTSPVISSAPSASAVCAGSNTSFSITATGTSLTYQWQVNTGSGFTNISGATSASLSLTSVTTSMNGNMYRCVVSGSCSPATTSSSATLTVYALPSISSQPSSSSVCAGGTTSFSVGASGAGLTYQWQVNDGTGWVNVTAAGPYSGPNTNTLTVSGAISAMNGYQYRCLVGGTCTPSVTSNSATLTINAAPAITTQPVSSNACPGGNDTFSVVATGAGISYQWQLNTGSGWSNISGATNATLIVTGVTSTMVGYQYRVVVSGTCLPPITSSIATLGLNSVPSITSDPSNDTVCENTTATFTTLATGTGLMYQWQVNSGSGWTNLTSAGAYSGTATNTLTISNTPLSYDGNLYRCVITGTCGTATSTSATLNVNGVPNITTQPVNAAVCPGSSASFSIAATGLGITYQWQMNSGSGWTNVSASAPYSGTTTNSLSISSATSGMAGYQYRCMVSGTCTPVATSNAATLIIDTLPSVVTNPINDTVCPGTNAMFMVTASGTGLTYQWQLNDGTGWSSITASSSYTGITTSMLTVNNVAIGMNGYKYRCIINGTCSPGVTSASGALFLNAAPAISSVSTGTTVCAGNNAILDVSATGTGLMYQWQVNTGSGWMNVPSSSPYSGGTTATLTINSVTTSMNGYMYRSIVSGTCNPADTSMTDTLTVNTAPSFVNPNDVSACVGTSTSIGITSVTGAGLSYQWQMNTGSGWSNVPASAPYSGTNTSTLSISSVTLSMDGYQYRVIVSGICTPAATSGPAVLRVIPSPSITTNPVDISVCAGNIGVFGIIANNATGYQWQVNSGSGWANLTGSSTYSGTNTSLLTISNASFALNGYQYRCIVTGICTPSVTSSVAKLTINVAPTITSQPKDALLCAGGDTAFNIAATGSGVNYQWQIFNGSFWTNVTNGGVYSGATTNRLVLTGVTGSMDGSKYRCFVYGVCTPAVISDTVTLTANTSPNITMQPGSTTSCSNGNPTFSVGVTGTGLTYQWQENKGTGFVNLTNTPPYSGVNTATLMISGVPIYYSGYQYRVIISGICSPMVTSDIAVLTVTNSTSWTGLVSTAWSNPANWACNTVPGANTNVTIPSTAPHMPLVDITNAICDSMTIDPGASVAFIGGVNKLEVKGSIINNGTFDASLGKVNFSGTDQQLVPASSYFDLQVSNAGDKVITGGNVSVFDSLIFDQGYLVLGNNNVIAKPLAVFAGGNATSYMLTNGLGRVVNENVGPGPKSNLVIPIGAQRNSYTPMTIDNAGVTDTFSVWVYDAVYKYYYNDIPTTGTWNSDAVGRSWIVEENTPGGSNVTLTLQWNASDELTGFDRNNCFMSHYTDRWMPGTKGVAAGSGPYSVTMSGIGTFSPFGVGSFGSPLKVHNVAGNSADIIVYPNPVSSSQLFVKFISTPSDKMSIRILDVLGKQWNTTNVDMSQVNGAVVPVDVDNLAQGVYLLQLTNAAGDVLNTVRFIKK